MPRGDRTGPSGMGPMTGRRAGFCTGNQVPGFMNGGRGYGLGFGRRGGRGGWGFRNQLAATGVPGWQSAAMPYSDGTGPYAPPAPSMLTKEQEIQMLKEQSGYLEEQLSGMRRRMDALEADTSGK